MCPLFFAIACNKPAAPSATHAPDEPCSSHVDELAHPGIPSRVRLDPAVAASAHVVTAPVRRERLVPVLTLTGEVVADPDRSARIAPPIAGRIESVSFKEGSLVAKGDVLAVLRIPELSKLKGAYVEAMAKAKAARATEERQNTLLAEHATSQQAYLDAKTNAETSEAEAAALGQEIGALGPNASGGNPALLTLRAPVSGIVLTRDAVVGAPVGTQQTLATIADLSDAFFLARVFEKDLARVHVDAKAEVTLNAYADVRFPGVIESLGHQIDTAARTVTARVRITNQGDRLRIGLFGTAIVELEEAPAKEAVLVVPHSAVTFVAGEPTVFVAEQDGDYELHQVVIGASALGKDEVQSGLREGEPVVVDGVFTLKSLAMKSTMAGDD